MELFKGETDFSSFRWKAKRISNETHLCSNTLRVFSSLCSSVWLNGTISLVRFICADLNAASLHSDQNNHNYLWRPLPSEEVVLVWSKLSSRAVCLRWFLLPPQTPLTNEQSEHSHFLWCILVRLDLWKETESTGNAPRPQQTTTGLKTA